MKIFIFRHGIAVDRDEAAKNGIDDTKRPLTEKGRDRNQLMLKWMENQKIKVDGLAVSPLLRAVQTAAQLKPLLNGQPKGNFFPGVVELIPSAPPQAFVQWLKANSKNMTSIMVVGHEPNLSGLASWLASGVMESFFELKKSGCILLEVENIAELGPRCANIKWVIGPKQICT